MDGTTLIFSLRGKTTSGFFKRNMHYAYVSGEEADMQHLKRLIHMHVIFEAVL